MKYFEIIYEDSHDFVELSVNDELSSDFEIFAFQIADILTDMVDGCHITIFCKEKL